MLTAYFHALNWTSISLVLANSWLTLTGKVSTSRSSGTDAIAEPVLPAPFR